MISFDFQNNQKKSIALTIISIAYLIPFALHCHFFPLIAYITFNITHKVLIRYAVLHSFLSSARTTVEIFTYFIH